MWTVDKWYSSTLYTFWVDMETLLSKNFSNTVENDNRGSNSETSITTLMRDDTFYTLDVGLFLFGSVSSIINAYW